MEWTPGSQSTLVTTWQVSLGFSIGLTFHNNMATVFVNNGCAPFFISDFFTDNILSSADIFSARGARLDFNFLSSRITFWGYMSHNTTMVAISIELRISLRPGQSHSSQHRNQSNLSNHDSFPRIEFELK